MYTHVKNIKTKGKPLSETGKALILVHGRGANADGILSLAAALDVPDFTLFAPQATHNSWYPYSFMAPAQENQPALNSSLELLADTVQEIKAQGITAENIYFLGFSQGACLTAEFVTRYAEPYGGIFILTGGLIGQKIDETNYKGNFENTPILITTGDPDMHVPVSRVNETEKILAAKGARVTKKIYPGRPHSISEEEIMLVKNLIKGLEI